MMQFRNFSQRPRAVVLTACLALLIPVAANAQAPKKIVTIEGITEYRLDNGLRLLLFPDDSTANVTVNLTMFVGSRHEGYGETGMAHLLEHMVFKGTPTHPEVPRLLKEHGANFNGTTWVDRTNYYETMRGTDANLEFGIKLEADRMVNSFIRREDLASEMTVVRNEFEMGENSPQNILSQRMLAAAYEWHNYGKSTIGNRSDIERVPIERLQGFYKKYYRPDNAMLVVAGKFDEKKALEFVSKYFGPLKNPAAKLETTYTEEPPQDGERSVTLRRVGKVGVVGYLYHIPAGPHEDFAALEMLEGILATEPSGRLYRRLVPTGHASRVLGYAFAWHDPSVLGVGAEVAPGKVHEVQELINDELAKLKTEKITDEEVTRVKTRFKRDRDLLMTDSNNIGRVLTEWAANGDWRLFFLHRDRVAKVTAADVQRVAEKYLQTNNRTVGRFIPTEQPSRVAIPETPDVTELVKDYKGGEAVVAGEAFEPSAENIQKRAKLEMPADGPKTAFLAKKTRGESVTLGLTLRFGNEFSLTGKTAAALVLGPMLARGTKQHTRQQLQDEFAKLGAHFGTAGSRGQVSVVLEVPRKTLPQAVALLREVLESPSFPQEEFDVIKRAYIEQRNKALAEPRFLALRSLLRSLEPQPKDNIRYIPTYEEEIARLNAMTLDQVKEIYADQLGGQDAVLVVVGDFAESGKRPELELLEFLRGWKAKVKYDRIASAAKTDIDGKREVIETPDKANAFYVAGHMLAINDSDPDYAALKVGDFLFGGGTLSSRLGNRIRQKEGLSYGANSTVSADTRDKLGRFYIMAISNPDNIQKVDKAVEEELARLLKDGVSADELSEAKKSYLERQQVQRDSDSALANDLMSELLAGRTYAHEVDLEKKIAALTVDDVNAALRKHWQPKKLCVVWGGDFKKKEK